MGEDAELDEEMADEEDEEDEEEEEDTDVNPLSPEGSSLGESGEDELAEVEDDEGPGEEYEYEYEEEEEEDQGATFDRIILQSNPGFLRQIQQVLQHGVRLRAAGYNIEDGASSGRRDPRRYRLRRRLQELPSRPYKEGTRLLNSGEFGQVDDPRCRKRRYEGAKTVTRFARFRELGWKRQSTLGITKRWLPGPEEGKVVAQYDRHVYSGQFSHDGTFFYTAAQDFKCRMYQTLNPANRFDWKLYKVRFALFSWLIFRPFVGKLDDGLSRMLHCPMITSSWHTLPSLPVYTLHERDQHLPWKLMPVNRGKTDSVPMKVRRSSISVDTTVPDGSPPSSTERNNEWAQTLESGLCDLVPMAENLSLAPLISVFMVSAPQ